MYKDKSSGKQYTQTQIEYNLAKAKKQKKLAFIEEYGQLYCHKCKVEHERGDEIDFNTVERRWIQAAHIKSIKDCKEESLIEYIWCSDNMIYECHTHHELRDSRNLQFGNHE